MTANSDRFLTAFGAIEFYLRALTGEPKRTRFYTMVDKAAEINAAVRRYADDLKEFADLRNAIIHERTDEHVIAEPNDLAVCQIEHIQRLLEHPPRVIPVFQKQVLSMQAADPIAAAAYAMLVNNYSQLPIYEDREFSGLLTTEGITRWLGRCAPQGMVNLEAVTIAEVLACRCEQPGQNYRFFSREETVFAALEAFQACEQCGQRLDAILITEHGSESESLLGIITIWDVPRIYEAMEDRAGAEVQPGEEARTKSAPGRI